MNFVSFLLFTLFTFSYSARLRDTLIGEWDVFPADSDFTQSSYTIEFHQSSPDPLDQSSLNCTLWKDELMHSHLPSAFVFDIQGPLLASLQIIFNSDYSGSIYNIKTNNFNQDSDINIQANFSFNSISGPGKNKVSRFKIGKHTFCVNVSELFKKGKIAVEVSSSLDENDDSLITSKDKYIIMRTKEFENKQPIRQKEPSKIFTEDNLERISNEPSESKFVNKIKNILNSSDTDAPNNYAVIIFALLFIFNIFIISKIISAICLSSKKDQKNKAPTKKNKKHKKKSTNLDNQKESVKKRKEEENQNETQEIVPDAKAEENKNEEQLAYKLKTE